MPRYISNKKLYDTDTAEAIATYDHSYKSQFNWYRETLYRTAKGNWFIYGTGNGASPYAQHIDNASTRGESFCPLSPREAQERLEKYGETDLLVELFNIEIA